MTCSNVTKYVSKSPEPASGKNGVVSVSFCQRGLRSGIPGSKLAKTSRVVVRVRPSAPIAFHSRLIVRFLMTTYPIILLTSISAMTHKKPQAKTVCLCHFCQVESTEAHKYKYKYNIDFYIMQVHINFGIFFLSAGLGTFLKEKLKRQQIFKSLTNGNESKLKVLDF